MTPYNPKSLANLTNTGAGRPKEGRKQYGLTLSPDIIKKVDEIAEGNNWNRNTTIEELLKFALGISSGWNQRS